MSTHQSYEVWAPKGERALCTFDTADAAWDFADSRAHVVPGLRVELVTTITRREPAQRTRKLRRVA